MAVGSLGGGMTLRRIWQDDSAQDMAEYALMLAVIVVMSILTVSSVGQNAAGVFREVINRLSEIVQITG